MGEKPDSIREIRNVKKDIDLYIDKEDSSDKDS